MDNLCIKGKIFGIGKPLVCVPVMAVDRKTLIEEVRRLLVQPVDMIEWRVDAFSRAESPNAVREVLMELAPIVCDTILVYTYRSKKQGGLGELALEKIRDAREAAAETGVADLIDVEYFDSNHSGREIARLRKMGARVIASHHDFGGTPQKHLIGILLQEMLETGVDVVKLAVMPKCMQDVLNLMEETNTFHENYPKQALITMSMGPMGVISRVAGEFFGSCVTFGAGENASAPGQLPKEDLQQILTILHRSLENEG